MAVKRNSINAHLTIVFAPLAVSRWIEDRTGELQAAAHTLTAADPLLREALARIHDADGGAHHSGKSRMSFLALLSPLVATVLGWAVLGQALTALQLVGFVLTLTAVTASQWRPTR